MDRRRWTERIIERRGLARPAGVLIASARGGGAEWIPTARSIQSGAPSRPRQRRGSRQNNSSVAWPGGLPTGLEGFNGRNAGRPPGRDHSSDESRQHHGKDDRAEDGPREAEVYSGEKRQVGKGE